MIETVSITKMYLKNLIRDSLVLTALEKADIGNWDEICGAGELPTDEDVDLEVEKIIENGG